MRKIIFLFSLFCISIVLFSCQFLGGIQKDETEHNTDIENIVTYEIQSAKYFTSNQSLKLVYPQLKSDKTDYEAVNSLILNKAIEYISHNVSEHAKVTLDFSVTLYNNNCICVLFEGEVVEVNAAYPTKIVFSTCISISSETTVDPLEHIVIDDDFINLLKEQLIMQRDSCFNDEQWNAAVDYVVNYSNELLKQCISSEKIALSNDGVIVCLDVPHAIGDYLKIKLPTS